MLRQSVRLVFMLVCLMIVASAGNAQPSRRFLINIPFDFVVRGQTLSAGRYAVEMVDPTKPNLLMLKNIENGTVRLIITQRLEHKDVSTASSLLFERRQGELYLSQVWMLGDPNGHQIATADEKNKRENPKPSAIVRLGFKK